VCDRPRATASRVVAPASYSSRMREIRNTS
jgi:hypothetical protein